ncbi:hypothetical protein [Agrilutibacter solisilvae]|uniref:Uncharacterized protein n=1 Tax=Agrilutibacter solisilvae TaxID=2763317 RepID=A0A974XZG4_9GAMM|nr:hypothetical protein [Lysobacter solisilvae]QSX78524.1 hypothetical protein I8J32_000780 [Lysobacter solisilvae]
MQARPPAHHPRSRAPDPAPAPPITAALPEAIGIATGLKGFLLWVGGSLAGITAMLYACGYLVTRAHMSMLGLYGFVTYDSDHFLQEGAKFLLTMAQEMAEIVAVLLAVLGLLLLVPGCLALCGRRRRDAWRERYRGWRQRSAVEHTWERGRYLLYGAAFVYLIAKTGFVLDLLYAPLGVANLLYDGAAPVCATFDATDSACLRQALLRGEADNLGAAFDAQLYLALTVVLLACVTWWIVMPWKWRAWLIAPFIVSVALCLLLLPMDYGVLQRPTIYPVLRLVREPPVAATPGRLFLISKTDGEFVVWDAVAHKVTWIPAGGISSAEIVQVRDLFEPVPASSQGTDP